jgi:hypothetical protein
MISIYHRRTFQREEGEGMREEVGGRKEDIHPRELIQQI